MCSDQLADSLLRLDIGQAHLLPTHPLAPPAPRPSRPPSRLPTLLTLPCPQVTARQIMAWRILDYVPLVFFIDQVLVSQIHMPRILKCWLYTGWHKVR